MRMISLLLVIGGPATAAAHEGRFGDPHTIVPFGRLAWSYTNVAPPTGDSTVFWSLQLQPGALIFVTRDVAVGGGVLAGYHSSHVDSDGDPPVTHGTDFGLEPRLGYNVALSKQASFFPQLGFGWRRTSSQVDDLEQGRQVHASVFAAVDLSFLFHFGNYFIGVGPFVTFDLWAEDRTGSLGAAASNKVTEVGAHTVLGGWIP